MLSSASTRAISSAHFSAPSTGVMSSRHLATTSARGIGLSLFWHGSGFTGGGEVKLASKASLELTERGARIRVASTEIGQGTRTMHAQIVADAGLTYADVDGYATAGFAPMYAVQLCEYLRLRPLHLDETNVGGAS